jgi:hypothetical protein
MTEYPMHTYETKWMILWIKIYFEPTLSDTTTSGAREAYYLVYLMCIDSNALHPT